MKRRIIVLFTVCMFLTNSSPAQHEGHHQAPAMAGSSPAIIITDSMTQEGSGTSWIPLAAPMPAKHFSTGHWNGMFHGNLTIRYTRQGSPPAVRHDKGMSLPSMFMASIARPTGRSSGIAFRIMTSFDRITEGGDGYPLLFQTGETWKGKPLVDRQHPHDLFGELSATYSSRLGRQWGWFVYAGYPGEPALGPSMYLHRLSSLESADAPLGHHWQDATHVSFGVATSGVSYKRTIRLEASVFTGREPDENRFDFDTPRFDSYSGRFSFNPHPFLSSQISFGYLRGPETLHPEDDVSRLTASILHHLPLAENQWWSNTFVWGQNNEDHASLQNSFLIESAVMMNRISVSVRGEYIEKLRGDLGFGAAADEIAHIGSFSFGALYSVAKVAGIDCGIGGQYTAYSFPDNMAILYGDHPRSFEIFLRFRPEFMKHAMEM